MSALYYTGGFAALPRPYPGPPELVAVVVLVVGAAGLRSLAAANRSPTHASRRLAVGAFSLGAAALTVTTASRFGCRLGLRPAAALGLGSVVAAIVAGGLTQTSAVQ